MRTKGVLLVDDEAMVLSALKRSLRLQFGPVFRYETALNAEEGLERIRALAEEGVEIALVISDWLMPGIKGDDFLKQVHALYPAIKFVMMTGHTDESEIVKLSGEVKLAAFVRKPWDPEELYKVVADALGLE